MAEEFRADVTRAREDIKRAAEADKQKEYNRLRAELIYQLARADDNSFFFDEAYFLAGAPPCRGLRGEEIWSFIAKMGLVKITGDGDQRGGRLSLPSSSE